MRLLQILWTLLWAFLTYALFLPVVSLNFGAGIYFTVLIYFLGMAAISLVNLEDRDENAGIEPTIYATIATGIFIVWFFIGVYSWGWFHETEYRNLIGEIKPKEFNSHIAPVNPEQMITVNEAMAIRIGQTALGEDPGLGSRCELGTMTMQRVDSNLYWIAPLVHSGFWKWENSEGTPGFVVVSATNEMDYRLVKEVNGKPINIKYQEEAFWGDDLERYMYMSGYASQGLTDMTFEVTEDWEPFWVVTLYDSKIGFSGDDATGILVIDPASGDIKSYGLTDMPSWIDRIQPEDFIANQIYYWGDYIHGYWNWGGTDKLHPSDEHSIVMGSDGKMYHYIGLQSKGGNGGTVGFIMVDCRTKEAVWIQQTGATESAAKKSAEDAISSTRYTGSEGITYNIGGHATYEFLMMGEGSLRKAIALVNVHDHNIVGTGIDRLSAIHDYTVKMNSKGNASIGKTSDLDVEKTEGIVTRFNQEVNGGNTIYYFTVTGQHAQFFGTSSISTEFCLTKPGDKVLITFILTENDVEIQSFDNLDIGFKKTEAENRVLARVDSVKGKQLEKQQEKTLDQKWEEKSPEEKRALLKK